MAELKPYQKMLWKKAKDAGLTLPNDTETANLAKPEIDRLVAGLEAGKDVFGAIGRAVSPQDASGPAQALTVTDPTLLGLLERMTAAMEAIADTMVGSA